MVWKGNHSTWENWKRHNLDLNSSHSLVHQVAWKYQNSSMVQTEVKIYFWKGAVNVRSFLNFTVEGALDFEFLEQKVFESLSFYLNVNDEGFVNWWEKLWNAMEAVCVKSVDGLFGVGGNLRWPWPLIWALTWLVLWFMLGCWVPLPTPNFPNKLGWLKLEK